MKDLDRRKLLSVSVDRPNVSWKFVELLQQEQAELYGRGGSTGCIVLVFLSNKKRTVSILRK